MTKRLFALAGLCLLCIAPARADLIKQGATYSRTFLETSTSDHITGATGLSSFTVTESKAGGTAAAITPTITEIGNGRYKVSLTGTDTNTLGALDLTITATGADPTDTHDQVLLDVPGATVASVTSTVGAMVVGYQSGQDPATVLKADSLFSLLLNTRKGLYDYNKTTHVLTLLKDDGTSTGQTVTLTVDSSGQITARH